MAIFMVTVRKGGLIVFRGHVAAITVRAARNAVRDFLDPGMEAVIIRLPCLEVFEVAQERSWDAAIEAAQDEEEEQWELRQIADECAAKDEYFTA